jgi:thiosulfate dehydrogenase (quinone) large subunit
MTAVDQDKAMDKTTCANGGCEYTLAFLLLRLWLGMRALVTGIEKFSAIVATQQPVVDDKGVADIPGALTMAKTKVYALEHYAAIKGSMATTLASEPLLPAILRKPYFASLGYILIVLGIMLLLGICTRTTLFLMGMLYISLTFGMILLGQDAGVAWLAIHVIMVAMALMLAKHNRLSITRRF